VSDSGHLIKVCGITCREDAEAAIAGGATALGFNFYPGSPRYIAPEEAARVGKGLTALRVGVFVNEPRARVEKIAAAAGLDAAQLHGEETPADYPSGLAVWKAVQVGEGFNLTHWQRLPVDALLLDGPAGLLYGGAGVPFDWRMVASSALRIVIAGGLDASNVREAVAQARPWGVDACSRIESAPGKKDHAKMMEFLQAAKAALA
jgi:phosphoribosylanthranilate isomerase